jgi:hypothetical protein
LLPSIHNQKHHEFANANPTFTAKHTPPNPVAPGASTHATQTSIHTTPLGAFVCIRLRVLGAAYTAPEKREKTNADRTNFIENAPCGKTSFSPIGLPREYLSIRVHRSTSASNRTSSSSNSGDCVPWGLAPMMSASSNKNPAILFLAPVVLFLAAFAEAEA